MTTEAQKDAERNHLKKYLRLTGYDVEKSNICQSEHPDFIVEFDGRRIGIEVMEFYHRKRQQQRFSRREVEAAWDKIVRDVNHSWQSRWPCLKGVTVWINFSDMKVPSKNDCDEFIDAVVSKISPFVDNLGTDYSTAEIDGGDRDILRHFVSEIMVRQIPIRHPDWRSNLDSGYVTLCENDFLETLKKKEKYAPHAELNLSESHLVVVGSDSWISGVLSPDRPEQLNSFSSVAKTLKDYPFDAVFLLTGSNQGWKWTSQGGWEEVCIPD